LTRQHEQKTPERETPPRITAPEPNYARSENYNRRFALANARSLDRFGKAAAEPPHSKMFCATETEVAGRGNRGMRYAASPLSIHHRDSSRHHPSSF
jgi:hypothetical protein